MTEGFKVSPQLTLPSRIAKQVTSIVGKRESGKTYNGGDLAEEMVKAGIPIVVLDSMGIWWGLRVAVKYVDGRQVPDPEKPGLPIVVFGGDHADIPLPMMRGQRIALVPDPEKIKLMARSIVESGISAVIDTSALPSKQQEMAVVVNFIPELQHINRDYGVRTIFLEETEVWAPQKPLGDEQLCLHIMNNLVKRGGNWNLGCVLMTQRSASINKDVLTQSDILMIGRLNAPQDKAAIQAWVERAGATDESRKQLAKWYDSLNELDRGEMWVWKPDPPKIRIKTKFRLRETLHATREFLESPEVRKVKLLNVDEYVEKFKKLFEPPKPKPVEKPKPVLTPEQIAHHPQSVVIARYPPGPEPNLPPLVQEAIREEKFEGALQVPQTQPTLNVPHTEPALNTFDEPKSMLGKICVVLYRATVTKPRIWSDSQIKQALQEHAWPLDGYEQARDQLVRWEILMPVPQGGNPPRVGYRFDKNRVQIIPQNPQLEVA
jgi:hypothetical protein